MKANIRFLRSLSIFIIFNLLVLGGHSSKSTLAAPAACVPGPHRGTITADQTWCAADNPHVLEGVVTIAPTTGRAGR